MNGPLSNCAGPLTITSVRFSAATTGDRADRVAYPGLGKDVSTGVNATGRPPVKSPVLERGGQPGDRDPSFQAPILAAHT